MRASKYIDKQTRAVIVDFNLYLPNTDNFVASIVLFEFTAGGAVIPTLKIKPWSRINYDDYSQWVPAFLEIALFAFYGYFAYHEVMRFFLKSGLKRASRSAQSVAEAQPGRPKVWVPPTGVK